MIQNFINYLKSIKGYSANTANSYNKDLLDFVAWMKRQQPSARWSTISRNDIDSYITSLVAKGLKASTTNRRISAISSLYQYMQREGFDVTNPCKYESRRKIGKTIPNTIPTEDIRKAYENSYGVVKVAIGLLASTGIRVQELLDLTWEDIDFDTQALRINGKGNKQRIVYSTPQMLEMLKNVEAMSHPQGRIFTIDQRQLRFMLFQALKPYSRAKQLSPHAIRHTFATNAASNGVNVSTLATILGHTSLETTQRYIDQTQAPIRKACQQYAVI